MLDALFTHFETHGRAAYAYERTGLKTSRYQTGFITNTTNWLMVRFSPRGSFVGLSSAARSESADDPFSMSIYAWNFVIAPSRLARKRQSFRPLSFERGEMTPDFSDFLSSSLIRFQFFP